MRGFWVTGWAVLAVACGVADEREGRDEALGAASDALVNGRVALDSEYPATVNTAGCSATKVGRFQFMMASHCVVNDPPALKNAFAPGGTLSVTTDNIPPFRWRHLTIVQTKLPTPFWYTSSAPEAPDVTLIQVVQETADIPVAVIDGIAVAGGDHVVKTGYGCDNGTTSPFPLRVASSQAFSHAMVQAYWPAYYVAYNESYVVTPRRTVEPSTAELCPGDSGGPLYRDVTPELLVVGVNSTAGGLGDFHTRVDSDSYYSVASWLAAQGARVRPASSAAAFGGGTVSATARIEAENYDTGGQGVGYLDGTTGNQGGSYRTEDVDVFAASGANNGQFVRAAAGEWLEYTVTASAGADYALDLTVAGSNSDGVAVHAKLDGEEAWAPVSVATTPALAWTTVTFPRVSLTPGRNRVRLVFDRAVDVDSLLFRALPNPCSDGVRGDGETDVDCGGAVCSACSNGKACSVDTDCTSNFCLLGQCSGTLKPVDVKAGNGFTCGRFADGSVRCWGRNEYGQLGVSTPGPIGDQPGELASSLQAVALSGPAIGLATGYRHACALLQSGAVQCWGANAYGQVGVGDTTNHFAPSTVDLGGNAVEVSLGAFYSCARLYDGRVKCWGHNPFGQLGVGHTASIGDGPGEMGSALVAVNLPAAATSISAGGYHACALLNTSPREVRCWGYASSGQLGYGVSVGAAYGDSSGELTPSKASLGSLVPISVAAGAEHTCAIGTVGPVTIKLKCWGRNDLGQLGYGDTVSRGNSSTNMGDNLIGVPVVSPKTVHAGWHNTCTTNSGLVRCWGEAGALLGQPQLASQGNIGDQPNEIATLPVIALGSAATVANLSVGYGAACDTSLNNTVKCWGANYTGQLGLGDLEPRGDTVGEMGDALPRVVFP